MEKPDKPGQRQPIYQTLPSCLSVRYFFGLFMELSLLELLELPELPECLQSENAFNPKKSAASLHHPYRLSIIHSDSASSIV